MRSTVRALGVLVCCLSAAALSYTEAVSQDSVHATQIDGTPARQSKKVTFDVAAIRPSAGDEKADEQFLPDGYTTTDRSLWRLITLAYYPDSFATKDRLRNAPDWVWNDYFDITAKVDPEDIAEWQRLIERRGL
jgi:hypothetical protein